MSMSIFYTEECASRSTFDLSDEANENIKNNGECIMSLKTNDDVLDCCMSALMQAKTNQVQSVTALKRHLHSQFAIPNSIIDEALLMLAGGSRNGSGH